jgi:L-lactate dehydrogenase complex protein LldG
MANNGSRELILQRIRTGLKTQIPVPPPMSDEAMIFPPVEDPMARFQQECKTNLMELSTTQDAPASAQLIAGILNSLPEGEIYVQDAPSLRQLMTMVATPRPIRWSSEGPPRESDQATVSLAEALVAQTGSVFVSAACGGRGISVVAPCHVVFATTSQLVPDLKTALGSATRKGLLQNNSFACMISGSSRTADIEKILVQGAHGPVRLAVILQAGS